MMYLTRFKTVGGENVYFYIVLVLFLQKFVSLRLFLDGLKKKKKATPWNISESKALEECSLHSREG